MSEIHSRAVQEDKQNKNHLQFGTGLKEEKKGNIYVKKFTFL